MTLFTAGQEAIAVWGADRKEYEVIIERVNGDGKTVKIRWNRTTSEGNQLVSSTFPIANLKKTDSEEDIPGCPGRFDDPENVEDSDDDY